MKFLVFALVAAFSLSASATPRIIHLKKGESMKLMSPTDNFSGQLPVGRISVITYQVELVGMLVTDPDNPTRKVKATLDFTPADTSDSNQVDAAMETISKFYDAKRGKSDNNGESRTVSKLIGVIYTTVVDSSLTCLGKDLEIPDLVTPLTVKRCYKVVPTDIIEQGL